MVLQKLNLMQTDNIQITLLRLKDGSRLIRLSEFETGIALERAMNPNRPLLRQKQQLKSMYYSMLQHSKLLAS